jgi:hypothetical protein
LLLCLGRGADRGAVGGLPHNSPLSAQLTTPPFDDARAQAWRTTTAPVIVRIDEIARRSPPRTAVVQPPQESRSLAPQLAAENPPAPPELRFALTTISTPATDCVTNARLGKPHEPCHKVMTLEHQEDRGIRLVPSTSCLGTGHAAMARHHDCGSGVIR